MTIKTKIAITATAFCLAFTANATPQRDAYDVAETALLDNVARTIQTGMKRVEKLYRNNGGVALTTPKNLIASDNPYVQLMSINDNYVLALKLHPSAAVLSASSVNQASELGLAEIPATMSDITINMVPIYAANNKKITGWECVTDADEKKAEVMGEQFPDAGKLSYISGITNFSFLGNCRFLATGDIKSPS